MTATTGAPRHSALVRVTHWLTAVCTAALLVSGFEIVISHPRFYWGENGNVMTPSLFELPVPASRPWVNTGYGYVLPDQNGWSRNLHFEAAWLVLFTGLIYVIASSAGTHLRKDLLPERSTLAWSALMQDVRDHLRLRMPDSGGSYNLLQRLSYIGVVFILFPLAAWTGLAMSPGLTSACPVLVSALGGLQSARTIHFFVSLLLTIFLVVHVAMVIRAGFRSRMRAMILS